MQHGFSRQALSFWTLSAYSSGALDLANFTTHSLQHCSLRSPPVRAVSSLVPSAIADKLITCKGCCPLGGTTSNVLCKLCLTETQACQPRAQW